MKTRTAAIALFAFLMAISLDMSAQRGRQGNRGNGQGYGQGTPGHRAGYGYKAENRPVRGYGYGLDLTDEQSEEIEKIWLAHRKEAQGLWNQMAELKVHQRTLMNAEKMDEKAINANIDKITALQNKIDKMRVKHMASLKNVLTEEQLEIVNSRRGAGNYGMAAGRGYGEGYGRAGAGRRYGDGRGRSGGRGAGNGYGRGW